MLLLTNGVDTVGNLPSSPNSWSHLNTLLTIQSMDLSFVFSVWDPPNYLKYWNNHLSNVNDYTYSEGDSNNALSYL